MTAWTVLTAPLPESLDAPEAWALHGASRITYDSTMAMWGHPDLYYPAAHMLTELHEETYVIRRLLVAVPEGTQTPTADDVVGAAWLELPVADNTHLGFLAVTVDPAHPRRGIGTTVLTAAEQLAAENGRDTLIGWSEHVGEPPAGEPGVLEPPTGSGRIRVDDAGAAFALHHGYVFEQAERYSVQRLPVDDDVLARLHAEALAKAGADYRLVSWTDRTPEEWLDSVALLETRMSTDPPLAGLDIRETVWNADRVRTRDQRVTDSGDGYLLVAAQHVPSHTLAAFTMVRFPLDRPEVVHQEDTLVLEEHRGHRLGMLVKSDLLLRLRELRPDAARVHTWNAEENAHMLAINVALGYRPTGVAGTWQKRLG